MAIAEARPISSPRLKARGPAIPAIAVILVVAAIGPWITPYDPVIAIPGERLLAPSLAHPFGTDENGIDVLSRVIASFRVDVFVALIGTALSVLIGAPLGVVLGYFEGRGGRLGRGVTELVMRLVDVIQAFPVFILAMVLVSAAGPGLGNLMIAIAFVNGPIFLRLVRSELLFLRERPYAEAAKTIGASPWRIGFVHLLPNALPTIIAQVSVTIGFSILLTAGLSFVGAGIQPPTPELGAMISTGSKFMILGQWWPSMFPGLTLGLIVFWFANGGDQVSDLLTPKQVVRQTNRVIVPVAISESKHHVVSDAVLGIRNLTVHAEETRLLNDVTISLATGECVAIVGPAGAGKSVLARTLTGVLAHQKGIRIQGSLTAGGMDLFAISGEQARRARGTVLAPLFSNGKEVLNPAISVGDFMRLAYFAHCGRTNKVEESDLVALLEEVGINDARQKLEAYPHQLSGGMAQRVCIALALMHRPKVLIADEPTAGLDVTVQRQVLDLMADIAREKGMARLIATRDLGIAAQYADRVLVLDGGQIVEQGVTKDIFRGPKTDLARRFFIASGVHLE